MSLELCNLQFAISCAFNFSATDKSHLQTTKRLLWLLPLDFNCWSSASYYPSVSHQGNLTVISQLHSLCRLCFRSIFRCLNYLTFQTFPSTGTSSQVMISELFGNCLQLVAGTVLTYRSDFSHFAHQIASHTFSVLIPLLHNKNAWRPSVPHLNQWSGYSESFVVLYKF